MYNPVGLKAVYQAFIPKWIKQKIKIPSVINNSMPDGINARVLMTLEIKASDNKRFKQVKKIQATFGVKLKSHSPRKINIPLLKPIMSETLLPFLNPRKPPIMRKRP